MGLLRLLLALSVVVVHSSQGELFGSELVGGQAAVQAFYVISGFYMALVLNRKYPVGLEGYKTFILARLFRLYPAYLFVLFLTVLFAVTNIVHHPAYDRWREQGGQMNVPTLLLYGGSQFTLVGQDAVWFTQYDEAAGTARFAPKATQPEINQRPIVPSDGATISTTVGVSVEPVVRSGLDFLFVAQAWTLSVELLFYAIAPFVVRRIGWIGILFVVSWAIRLTLVKFGYRENPWSYRFFPSELAMFLMGSAAYHAYAWMQPKEDVLRKVGIVALPAMVGIVLFLFEFKLPLRSLIVAGATAVSLPFIFALTRRNAVDRWIGELSYPVYITHELVRLALIHYQGEADVRLMALVTVIVSVVTMLLIEQPIERMRARFINRRRGVNPAVPLAPPAT